MKSIITGLIGWIFFGFVLVFLSSCSPSPIANFTQETAPLMIPSTTPVPTRVIANTSTPLVTETVLPTQTPKAASVTPTSTAMPLVNKVYPLPDGDYLLFEAHPEFDIRAINRASDNSLIRQDVTAGKGFPYEGNALSPDGKFFVYALVMGHGLTLLNLSDDSVSLVPGGEGCAFPSFAPDGQHVAVICPVSGPDPHVIYPPGIFILDLLNGTRSQQIIALTSFGYYPLSWSPDGKILAFLNSNTPNRGYSHDSLHLLDVSCFKDPQTCPGKTRLFAWSQVFFWHAPIVWSQDGQNILIRDGTSILRGINLLNGTSTNYAKTGSDAPGYINGYAWSPDNQYIAFSDGFGRQIIPVVSKTKSSAMEGVVDRRDGAYLFDWFKVLEFKVGRSYVVTSLAKDLVLREKPSLDGKVIQPVQPNTTVTLVDGPVNADYYTWWKMKVADVEGWAQGIKYWFDAVKS